MSSILNKAKAKLGNTTDNMLREKHDIAVIGIDGCFPSAVNPSEFWERLINSQDCLSEIPLIRKYDAEECLPLLFAKKGVVPSFRKMNYIDRIDLFDYNFFSLSKRECELMDPGHKMVLETVWKCIENAGYGARISGTKTGVFVGYSDESYYMQMLSRLNSPVATPTETDYVRSAVAGRISYLLDLTGPSLVIDTACSSSLVAVHYACQALRNDECGMAIVASAKAVLLPLECDSLNKTESRDGVTCTFDERANGMGVGEGAASILLKPLHKAINDGDYVYAVIRGSAVNQDGKTNGFTSPSANAQADVIVSAWKDAKIDPSDLSYLEAHGTATQLGDPIEIEGIRQAFEKFTTKKQFCAIGSVKANIGHLDHAAGLAGLIKVILMLNHKQIPPQMNFKYPNKKIPFHKSPVFVNDFQLDCNSLNKLMLCGINSFGLTGTNCHLVIGEADRKELVNRDQQPYLFTLTAHTRQAMRRQLSSIYSFVKSQTSLSVCDLCYTSNVSKRPDKHKIAFIIKSVPELLRAMQEYRENEITQRNKGIYVSGSGTEVGETIFDVMNLEQDIQRLVMLHGLAEKFTGNQPVNLFEQYVSQPKIIPLPSEPFVKECCWIHPSDLNPKQGESFLHTIKWEKCPLMLGDKGDKDKHRFLIIGDDSLISGMDQEHVMIYSAKYADVFSEIDRSHYTVDGSFQGFHQLLRAIGKYDEITNIIYLPPSNSACIDSLDAIEEQYDSCVNRFILLYKALQHQKYIKQLNLCCVAQHVDHIIERDRQVSPMNAALFAMIQAVGVEDFDITCKCIDVDGVLPFSELLKECSEEKTNIKVAYRDGIRYSPFITPLKEYNGTSLGVKNGGVYVISGGAGEIGLSLAGQLALAHAVTIILLGRRALSDLYTDEILYNGYQLKVKEIEDKGSKVIYYQADVSNQYALESVLNSVRGQFGQIDGIIHSAGVNVGVTGALLKDANVSRLRQDMAVKIHGTVLLDCLTRRDKLDFFILITSPITWIGGVGVSDYMASNAFESNYAVYRNSAGFPTKAIGWAPWLHSINTQGEVYDEENQLFRVLTQKDIDLGWNAVFGSPDVEVSVGRLNLSNSIKLLDGVLFRLSPEILVTELASGKAVQSDAFELAWNVSCEITGRDNLQYTQTEREVAQAWSATLGMQRVDINENFFESGGHSILAIKLEVALSDRILYTDVYRYPTVTSLAAYIDAKEKG